MLELCGDDEGLDYAPTTPGAEDPPDIEVTEEGLAIQQELDVQEVPDDRQHLTHRLHGKQTVPRQRQDGQDSSRLTHRLHGKQSDPRAIAVLRIGGECYQRLLQGGLCDGRDLRGKGGLCDGRDLRGKGGLCDGRDLRGKGGLCDGRDLRGKGGLCDGRDLRGKGGLCDGRDLRGKGGLCDGRELHGMSGPRDEGDPGAHGENNPSGQEKRQLGHGGAWNQQQMHNETAIALLQLKNLRKWEQEERAMMASTEDAEMIMDVQGQCERLEGHLCVLQQEEGERWKEETEGDTLVAKTIPIEEVRKELPKWQEAMVAEYESLIQHGAIEPIDDVQYEQLKREKEEVKTIPGMMVSVLKPPQRRKARFVACGNYMGGHHEKQDVSAGGLDCIVVRTMLSLATKKRWAVGTADVKTAFLQAPRREQGNQCTIINPPNIAREAGILRFGGRERWRVRKAVYGLVESPKDWAVFRDQQLRTLAWTTEDGRKVKLVSTMEAHLWAIVDEHTEERLAYVGIYVDDILVVGSDAILTEMMERLSTIFQMAPYDKVTQEQPVTFCGYEIYKEENGYGLRQENYIQELLSRRAVEGKEGQPLPKIVEGEDEEQHELWVVREVQAIVGELQWLATRTRPDLSYATAFVARLVHRRPAYALKLCHFMLRYLARYPTMGLFYGEDDQLDILKVKADTSYGPPHEQYRSVQGVAIFLGSHLLLWTSSRQAFVTLSTAECELVGYTEALQCTESLSSLLELMQVAVPKVLEGDSRAALAQIQNDGGSWRTRHLRLRAWRLREAMADPSSSWRSQHCAGLDLAADGLTKALGGQSHRRFLQLLGMTTPEDNLQVKGKGEARVRALHGDQEHGLRLLEHAATALASAGGALAIGSEHRSLGVVLLLSSVVVGCLSKKNDGWTLNGNDDKKNVSRKEQDPETRKEKDPEIRKSQKDGSGKSHQNGTQGFEEKAYGTCRQDQKWTDGRKDQETVDFQAKSWEVEGCCPGLRAFRMNKDGSGGASQAMESTTARRGAAAMASASSGEAGTPNSFFGTINSGYGVPAGYDNAIGGCGTSRSAGASMGGYATSSGGGASSGVGASSGNYGAYVDRGEGVGAHGREVGQSGELRRGIGRDPWILEQYLHPPRPGPTDEWATGLMPEGWLIRHHRKIRKRLFTPLHGSLPIDPTTLGTERITVRVFDTGARMVTLDDWRMSARTDDKRQWRGYTFFKVKKDDEEDVRASGSTPGSGHGDNESDLHGGRGDQGARGSGRTTPSQTSSYEGLWRSEQAPRGSHNDPQVNRFGSVHIPPIEVNVTVNNFASGLATTSRRMELDGPNALHGATSSRRTSGGDNGPPSVMEVSEDDDAGSFSFVDSPEHGDGP